MKQLSFRSIITGLLGLTIITASSMYVALKMGALPWPTVFVTVLSMAILGKAKNSSLQEINVTHTIMSSGAMVAGGLAFTLPGLWIINPQAQISTMSIIAITVVGAVLGTLFSSLFRKNLLDNSSLSYPIGNAAYNTLITGTKNGKNSIKLFSAMGASIVFTTLRDAFGFIPSVLTFGPVNFWVSPMALAIGGMIGRLSAYLWLGGAVVGLFLTNTVVKQSLGIGIMLGTGIGVLAKALITFFKSNKKKANKTSGFNITRLLEILAVCFGSAIILSIFTGLPVFAAILTVAGIALVTLLSGILTGQSGVNPMEIFGILLMLAISLVSALNLNSMFVIASVAAVACGLCGDVMNDLMSGRKLNTDPKQQLLGEGIGGVIGAIISVVTLLAMKKTFGNFGTDLLPAPQATAVATMAGGFGDAKIIIIGAVIGTLLYLVNIPAATLGLGIYVANQISFAVGLGAIIANILKSSKKINEYEVNLVSSGLLGGEGITGVIIAIIAMLS